MRLRILMAAVRKGTSGALDRVTSAGTGSRNKPKGTPVRAYHPNSSPVYKTQSETSLTAGLRNLTIKDKNANKRTFSGKSSSNTTVKNLTDASNLLQTGAVQNVIIVAGAGISTPSGIPDFRSGKDDIDELSPGTGLYDNLQQYQIPYPEAIFDIDYFHTNPRPFFTLAKELYPSGKYRPNYVHYFARMLHDKGMLLRMYTQNIDGLERLAGVPADKLVEAHGTFATATCTICNHKMEGEDIKEKIFADKLPRCPTRGCVGIAKPDIVFFGEDLPRKFYSYMKDMLQADMVLVMGTSLEVQPFAGIIDTVRMNVPRILFNREAVGPFRFSRRSQDLVAAGDLIDNMVKFSGMVGWKEEMVQLITKEEGEFKIENWKRKAKVVPPKSKNGKEINKSPPKPPGNQTRNYSSLANRYRGTRYSDSSSSEESESESSSDSSEEETKISRFRGVQRAKITNGYQRNGAATKQNGLRCASAKLDNSNKRRLHTEADDKAGSVGNGRFVGNMTGRSVKSESGINKNLAKRRLEDKSINQKSIGNGNFVKNPETREKVTKADREQVLRKYGLSPHPKYKTTAANRKVNDPTVRNKVAVAETVYLGQKKNNFVADDNAAKQVGDEKTKVSQKSNDEKLHTSDKTSETEDKLITSHKNGETSKVLADTPNKTSETEDKLTASDKTGQTMAEVVDNQYANLTSYLKRENSIVSGYFIDDNVNIETKGDEHRKNWRNTKKTRERDDHQHRKTEHHSHISDTQSNLSSDSKVLKTLSDKTVQSFAKYASLSMQRRVIGKGTQAKPPSGIRNRQTERELGILNPKPYGFANKFKNSPTGVIPFKRTQAPALNRSVQYSDLISITTPASPDLPKISYRHTSQPGVNKYDARVFGPRPGVGSSSEGWGTSDDDSR